MEEERKIVEDIRNDYLPKTPTQNKVDELRELDLKARLPAIIFTYTYGIIGALVLGLGMCLAMSVIGNSEALGIIIGVVGIAIVGTNYFIYEKILQSRKRKYASKITAISDEILNNK